LCTPSGQYSLVYTTYNIKRSKIQMEQSGGALFIGIYFTFDIGSIY
jgi:hypothetical protein